MLWQWIQVTGVQGYNCVSMAVVDGHFLQIKHRINSLLVVVSNRFLLFAHLAADVLFFTFIYARD